MKLNRFNDFIIESLLNESLVVFSDKFRKILTEIDNPVSTSLQEIENKDLKVQSNYIDISPEDKETISFIPDRRAQDILNNQPTERFAIWTGEGGSILTHNLENPGNRVIYGLLEYTPTGEKGYQPQVGERVQVLKSVLNTENNIRYVHLKAPGGECACREQRIRYEDTRQQVWTRNRQTVRTGRGIRALLASGGIKSTDTEIEAFVNQYKAAWDKMNDVFRLFELVEGDKISFWYNRRNYSGNGGSLSSSCMSGVPASYFDIYVQNPTKCKLLILKDERDETKIKGRALVWNLDIPEGITFVDRVYTHADSDVDLFKQYAKLKGWYTRYTNGYADKQSLTSPTGEVINGWLTTNVKSGGYKKYPYLDTMLYYSEDTGELTTNHNLDDKITLCDTGGGYDEMEGDGCENCGGSGRVDCYECDGSGTRSCPDCDESGRIDCPKCEGEGEIKGPDGEMVKCDECNGEGDSKCDECNGRGELDCPECDGDGRVDCPDCQ
jgi:hypothetical protein